MVQATYIEGPLGSGKTRHTVAQVASLLATQPSHTMLVLCSNHARQQQFSQRLLSAVQRPMGQVPVYTYAGFVRQTLMDCWLAAEALLNSSGQGGTSHGQPVIRPTLCGFEVTERLLAGLVREEVARNPEAFADFPGDERALVRQLVRRLRLRAENRLTRHDMVSRSEILLSPALVAVAQVEQQLDALTARLRMLDPARQLDLFHTLLESPSSMGEQVRAHVVSQLQHVVAEDMDETIPAQQVFLRWLMPQMQTVWLTADIDGGSRRGYLNAYPYDWPALKALCPGETRALTRDDAAMATATGILHWWQQETSQPPVQTTLAPIHRTTTRIEMLDAVVESILDQTRQGRRPGEMAIVLPHADGWTLDWLAHRLTAQGIPVQTLTGSQTPSRHGPSRTLLLLIQWCQWPLWRLTATEWRSLWLGLYPAWLAEPQAVSALLMALAAFPPTELFPFPTWADLVGAHPPLGVVASETMVRQYESTRAAVVAAHELPLLEALYQLFLEQVTPTVWPKTALPQVEQLLQSATLFLEMATRWSALSPQSHDAPTAEAMGRAWLTAVKAGVVADTPAQPLSVSPQALLLATPQKLIDVEAHRPWMAWLDVGSRQWARSDSAPLYNAWVHSALWTGDDSGLLDAEVQARLIRVRAGHLTRTLALLATDTIVPFASAQDDEARDLPVHTGTTLEEGLLTLLGEHRPTHTLQRATLREDQQGVLAYQGGTMAIAAVPGAGKTFVNVELVLELVFPQDGSAGLPPEQILILTYMESAARTLLGRLQQKLQTAKLPTVSTIHGLAFRLLTENDHYRLLGDLPEELAILDDYAQQTLIQQLADAHYANHLQQVAIKDNTWRKLVQRAITEAKFARLSPQALAAAFSGSQNPLYAHVAQVYAAYVAACRAQGQLDFTDLILEAIRLLETRPEVRAHYQQQFRVIIEDEAQDSSTLLQQFIALLGGDAPNLVRTGDTNQSITTTFSAADPAVFRLFTESADRQEKMYMSGRCAPEVMALANAWLLYCIHLPQLANAFVHNIMKPVAGQNPTLLAPLATHTFATDVDERQWWVGEVHRWQQEAAQQPASDKPPSMALLLATNDEVLTYTRALQQAGIAAVSLTESVQELAVFAVQRVFINLLVQPANLAVQAAWVETLRDTGLLFLPPFVAHETVGYGRADADLTVELVWLAENALFQTPVTQLPTATLQRMAYDLQEFNQLALTGDIHTLLVAIAHRYFADAAARSNGVLCALAVQRQLRELGALDNTQLAHQSPLEVTATYLEALHRGRKLRRVFSEALEHDAHGLVQVMTLHKSKGQEFDRVGMPGLTESQFKLEPEDELTTVIRAVGSGQPLDAVDTTVMVQEKMEERARLMYVGLTRARRHLVLTTSQQITTRYGKLRAAQPSSLFAFAQQYFDNPMWDRDRLSALLADDDDGNEAPEGVVGASLL